MLRNIQSLFPSHSYSLSHDELKKGRCLFFSLFRRLIPLIPFTCLFMPVTRVQFETASLHCIFPCTVIISIIYMALLTCSHTYNFYPYFTVYNFSPSLAASCMQGKTLCCILTCSEYFCLCHNGLHLYIAFIYSTCDVVFL